MPSWRLLRSRKVSRGCADPYPMNVARIQEMAETGDLQGAHDALDSLLSMGPHNLEALKLRARLHEVAGRFHLEAQLWEKVAQIARDDNDLLDYLVRRQTEDRENFYFTDTLPGGGKRFLAFPRRMVRSASVGLIGCLTFLTVARLGQVYTFLLHPVAMLGSFFVLVMAPWIGIIWSYAKSIRHVSVTSEGVTVATRFKTHFLPRGEIERVCMVHDDRKDTWRLSLVLVTKDKKLPCVEIDFNENSTSLRARSYFAKELHRYFGEPEYCGKPDVKPQLQGRKVIQA